MFRPVALKMLKLLSKDNVDFNEVTRVLQADPGFAAEILTLANSALYAGYSQVHTVMRALVVLGIDRVKTLTMTVAMRAFMRSMNQTADLQDCWSHSRACALLGEELAGSYDISRDRAYTGGLMHDLGRFGLLAGSSREYEILLARPFDTPAQVLEAEREQFGFDHCQAGELLARTWRLPSSLSVVTGSHHAEITGPVEDNLIPLTQTACRLAGLLGFPSVRYCQPPDIEKILDGLPGHRRNAQDLQLRLQEKFNALDLA